MKIEDTTIQLSGVMRCCIASFTKRGQDEVKLNDKGECEYCHVKFTLVDIPKKASVPIWMPDWQLNEKA